MKKLTTIEFINRANIVHKNVFDYSKTVYIGNKTLVTIRCIKHGDFVQRPDDHLNGHGCSKCGFEKTKQCNYLTTAEFINNANIIHKFKYDYSLVRYINSQTKITIICSKHGVFSQNPNNHLNGHRCPKCFPQKIKGNLNMFITKAIKIHGNIYDYSSVNYVNSKTKVKIICKKHGLFEQTPNMHLLSQGCPYCRESNGEKRIRTFLEKNQIIFIKEKKFDDCKNIKQLSYDYYLPNNNILIEYDGIQHFKAINYFGGEEGLVNTKNNDKIKTEYANNNKIKLIRISYWEDVNNKLINLLFS